MLGEKAEQLTRIRGHFFQMNMSTLAQLTN